MQDERVRKKIFKKGDKVRVVAPWRYKGEVVGIISVDKPDVEKTLQGEDFTYWVRFLEPAYDSLGKGPMTAGSISSRHLVLADEMT